MRTRWLLLMALALWAALGAAYLGRWWWPLDLFAHFQVQYAVLFAVACVVALMSKRRAIAVLAGAGALVSAAPVLSYAGLTSATASNADFRLVSFNTWYRNRDHARLAEYLALMNPDVIVLQEITPQQVEELRSQLPQHVHAYSDAAKPHGAAVLSRWPITAAMPLELTSDGARAAEVRVKWRDVEIAVIGVHLHWPLGPNASRMRNLELAMLAQRAKLIEGPVLITGDFNITPWSQRLHEFAAESGLIDCARGHSLAPTWPAQFPPLQIRIDHCFASPEWRAVDVNSGPYLGSDHRPMVAELELTRTGLAASR